MATRKRKKAASWIDDLFSGGLSSLTPQYVGRRRSALEVPDSGIKVKVDARPIERRTFKKMFCRVEFNGKPEDFGVTFDLDDFSEYEVDPLKCKRVRDIEDFLAELLASLAGPLGEAHPYYVGTDVDVYRKRLRIQYEFGKIPE